MRRMDRHRRHVDSDRGRSVPREARRRGKWQNSLYRLVRMKIPRPCLQRFSKSGVGPGIWICNKYLERFWCRWLGNHTLRSINIMGANIVDMESRTVVSWEVSTNGLGLLDGFYHSLLFCSPISYLPSLIILPSPQRVHSSSSFPSHLSTE